MEISIIIPSFNGEARLPFILQSLLNQTYKNFEVIVVIDGSTDNSINVIDQFKPKLPQLLCVYQKNLGRAGARNAGARQARTERLIFFDDDVKFDETLLKNYVKEIDKGFQIIAGVAEANTENMNIEFYNYANYLNKKWSTNLDQKNNQFLNAQNFYIAKECFTRLGGFDERLRDSEDFDLAARASTNGIDIFLAPHLVVKHFIQENFMAYAQRLCEYNHSRKVLYMLKPELKKDLRIKGGNLRRYIDKIFSHEIWIKSIDSGLYKSLPSRFRFRLYDFLLRAFSTSAK